jgi:SAM-dependent methyltransferase
LSELLSLLACPACRGALELNSRTAWCACGSSYQVRDGVPVLLVDPSDLAQRQAEWFDLEADEEWEIERPSGAPNLYAWLLEEKFERAVGEINLNGSSALVVCAGSGMDAEFLAGSGAAVVALDISPGAARRANERARRHRFQLLSVVGDVERLPFRDASVDVAYVHDGLHHLANPLVGLAEMARVARHAVCVTEPARAAATHLAVRIGLALEREDAGNRVARLSLDEVRSTLAARGFDVVTAERYAMYYRHEPGRAARLLSAPGIFAIARAGLRVVNLLVGARGNKLVVVGVRP